MDLILSLVASLSGSAQKVWFEATSIFALVSSLNIFFGETFSNLVYCIIIKNFCVVCMAMVKYVTLFPHSLKLF